MYGRIRVLTLVLVLAAWVVAVGWLVSARSFESALSAIVLLATITTLYVDLWLVEKERRRELLSAVVHELFVNIQILTDPIFSAAVAQPERPVVFPRLVISAIPHAISSGAFTTTRDSKLFKLLHAWNERAHDFNQRLSITEICAFIIRDPVEIAAFRNTLPLGWVFVAANGAHHDLAAHLLDRYAGESGITKDTVLFKDAERAV